MRRWRSRTIEISGPLNVVSKRTNDGRAIAVFRNKLPYPDCVGLVKTLNEHGITVRMLSPKEIIEHRHPLAEDDLRSRHPNYYITGCVVIYGRVDDYGMLDHHREKRDRYDNEVFLRILSLTGSNIEDPRFGRIGEVERQISVNSHFNIRYGVNFDVCGSPIQGFGEIPELDVELGNDTTQSLWLRGRSVVVPVRMLRPRFIGEQPEIGEQIATLMCVSGRVDDGYKLAVIGTPESIAEIMRLDIHHSSRSHFLIGDIV